MLGVAIRVAQRMGIHSESALAKCDTFEAEMRRRLWWSLVLYDSRIGERAGAKSASLDPTWDCRPPSNVNESDLRPEMKGPLKVQESPTDAIYVVIRSTIADFVRHSDFYLDFTSPALKPIARLLHEGSNPEDLELRKLDEVIEQRYLSSCDEEIPVHYMIVWIARIHLVRYRLLEHHSRLSGSGTRRTEAQHDTATSYALRNIECDLKILSSPLVRGFLWLHRLYYPFPAYFQVLQDLKRRPFSPQAELAWELMSDNYEAWFDTQPMDDGPFFQIFAKIVIQAWKAREAASNPTQNLVPPRIVAFVKRHLAKCAQNAMNTATQQTSLDNGFNDSLTSMPSNFANQSYTYNIGTQLDFTGMNSNSFSGISGQSYLDTAMNNFDWSAFSGQPLGKDF